MKSIIALAAVLALACSGGCHRKPSDRESARPAPESAQAVSQEGASTAVAQAKLGTPVPTPEATVSPSATPAVAVDRSAQVVFIGYHRFVERVRHPDTEITPENFEKQMQMIRDAGVTVISMKDFLAWRRGEKNIPHQSAVITIDDGWNSAFDVAWPILQRFGYPFTMFIYTDYVKGGPKSGGGSLTWEQLGEMRDAGVDIESHTISHRDLRGRKSERGTPQYEEWLWNELHGSKEQLERELGIAVKALALPYGYHNEHVLEVAKKAGYEAVFTVYGQKVDYATPMDKVGRYIIVSNQPKIFAEAIRFAGSAAAAVAEVAPKSIKTDPADGAEISDESPVLKANLGPFGEIDPKSVQMRISGFGLVPASYDPKSKAVSFELKQKLREKEYTVIVSAKAGSRKVETRWRFKYRREEPHP